MNIQMAKQLRRLPFPPISMLQGLVAMLSWWQYWATTSTSHEARDLTTHYVGVQIKTGNRHVSPAAGPQGVPTCKPHSQQSMLSGASHLGAGTEWCAAFLPLVRTPWPLLEAYSLPPAGPRLQDLSPEAQAHHLKRSPGYAAHRSVISVFQQPL